MNCLRLCYVCCLFVEFKSSLRKLEHENNDLKFLNNQYVHKIRSMERESKDKSDHILKLQEKNFNAVIQTPGMFVKYSLSWLYANRPYIHT